MIGKRWTRYEEEYVLKHADMGAIWIAKQLGRSHHSINQRAYKLRTGLGTQRKKLKIEIKSSLAKQFVQKRVRYPTKPSWRFMRNLALERDNYVCVYCGQHADTVDHIVARSKGGQDNLDNLVAACRRCNTLRGTSCVECPQWQRKQAI